MTSQIIFSLFLLMAIASFCRTVTGRFKSLKGKKLDLKTDNLGHRAWRVLKEVIFQTRVVRGRPFVGMMHGLVMAGFIFFAWISLKHCLVGFGFDFDISGGFYGSYVAFWAAATTLGILVLAFRRFILKPKELGHLSPTSGIVALLIVILMGTYIWEWGWLDHGTLSWKINWWIHTAALLGMIVIIPRSKHLHLLLAPVAIFFRSETTSQIRPLDLEAENPSFGLTKFSELTAKDILDLNACVECGRCTVVCPANSVGKELNPKEIILQMQRGLLAGADSIIGTEEEVEEKKAFITEKEISQCLSCGACEQACPVGIEHVGFKIMDLRRGIASEEKFEDKRLNGVIKTMLVAPYRPQKLPPETRESFIRDEKFPIFSEDKEWLFWLGCGNGFEEHGQKVAKAMRDILDTAGITWGVLENEICCGEPARRLGREDIFLEASAKLISVFRRKGVKKILSCCPHCTTMFDKDYRQIQEFSELGITVAHHVELLSEILPKLNLKKEKIVMTFHDSCYMARGRNVYKEPRKILKACGAQIIEMERHGKETFCCGAGGGQIFFAEDKPGKRVNEKRFKEAEQTGAKIIGTECNYCPLMLTDAANASESAIKTLDVAEIVASRLKDGGRC